jgi:ABC-type polysaccharide/polyol phosphate export permease
MVFPVGLCIIPNLHHFSFSFVAVLKFLLLHALANIFYGFFCLYTAGLSPNPSYITTIRSRFIFPLWNLGCANFSWNMLYNVWPVGAYINLLNPMTYILEGLRSTLLPEFNSLNYWICVSSTLFFIFLFGYLSLKRLKKRLDCL